MSFKNALLKLGWPILNSYFKIHNPVGLKLLTRLWVELSHLNEQMLGRPILNSYFNIHNPVGLKLLTRLRVELSLLNEHKFKQHISSNCINPLCCCSLEVESTIHFFLHWFIVQAFVKSSLMNWFQYLRSLLIFFMEVLT